MTAKTFLEYLLIFLVLFWPLWAILLGFLGFSHSSRMSK